MVRNKEIPTEYKKRIENVSNTVKKWSEEREEVQKSKMESDEEIYQEVFAVPCIAPRIIIRELSVHIKAEDRKLEKDKLVPQLPLRKTLPVKLQKTNESQCSSTGSRDSGRAYSDRSSFINNKM